MANFNLSDLTDIDTIPEFIVDESTTKIEEFCTNDSFDASANYLNTLLTSYGYPVPLIFDSDDIKHKCKIVNCIYSLMNDKKKDDQEKQEYRRMINEMKKQQQEIEQKLASCERDLKSKQNREKELEAKLYASEATVKKQNTEIIRSKEEVTRIKHNIQYLRTQFEHETRRHEQEFSKTQERLLKLMHDHYKVNVAYLHVNQINFEAENDQHDHVQQLHETYTQLSNELTRREADVRQEALELRNALIEFYTELRRFLEQQIETSNSKIENRQLTKSHEPLKNVYEETVKFRLPMDCGGQEAVKMIHDLLGRLKEEWQLHLQQRPTIYTDEDMKDKLDQIKILEQTVQDLLETLDRTNVDYEEKIKIYRKFEQGGFFDNLCSTAVHPGWNTNEQSDSEDSIIDLDPTIEFKHAQILKQSKKSQQKITEAALKLALERDKLEVKKTKNLY
ncbi:Afadin and alpha-actinin-binding-domain-containing protein [Mycotypha africana]|uniref:Afadin and alpha-actinin-binding-domain-containing protein n=1 Tax=Mycotypha africana TaxID=64632 RepID=UPI0023004878|nr:Afadin and alpha-actinin-binding-domain-containing protein [Mycotypha africana]KAI8984185.1 Afadin and alpha-actinin-binding-domain-containing protein [Mycotypha africana]